MFVVCGKAGGQKLLSLLCEGSSISHQVEDCRWNGESIIISLNFLFFRILDLGVVDHERDSIRFVVRIIHRCFIFSQEWDAVVSVTILVRTRKGEHEKERFVFQTSFTESKDDVFDVIIRPSHRIEPAVEG